MTLAKNIRYLRKKNNWSQEELADKLGKKSFTTIQKWESGVGDPTFKTLLELAKVFKVDIDTLARADLEAGVNDVSLSLIETTIINDYRSLNIEGQEKVRSYLSDLIDSGKYKKHSTHSMVENA